MSCARAHSYAFTSLWLALWLFLSALEHYAAFLPYPSGMRHVRSTHYMVPTASSGDDAQGPFTKGKMNDQHHDGWSGWCAPNKETTHWIQFDDDSNLYSVFGITLQGSFTKKRHSGLFLPLAFLRRCDR